jgi:hypothetical protein
VFVSLIYCLIVDGGCFCLKHLFWFLAYTYFFEAFMWWLLVFSILVPLQLNLFYLRIQPRSLRLLGSHLLEFFSYLLIGSLSICRSHSLSIQCIIVKYTISTSMFFSKFSLFCIRVFSYRVFFFLFLCL